MLCTELAKAIAADAEGATHLITLSVEGLRDDAEARRVDPEHRDSRPGPHPFSQGSFSDQLDSRTYPCPFAELLLGQVPGAMGTLPDRLEADVLALRDQAAQATGRRLVDRRFDEVHRG